MRRKSSSLAAQSLKLGLAVPQVVAHRLTRMDPVEFQRMGTEKLFAFQEAWSAMAMQSVLEQQKLAFSLMQSGMSIFTKGLAPVSRRAAANARRLRRSRRR